MQDCIKLCITSSHFIDHYCDLFETWNTFVSLEVRFITFTYHFLTFFTTVISSPSQRRGGCGHMMAGFDHHSVCARCRDKKKGSDPCVKTPPEVCQHCDILTPEQKVQLSTPSYKLKKEKKDAKSTPMKETDTLSPTLVDPELVSVVGVVDGQSTPGVSALSEPAEKKKKSETKHSSKSTRAEKSVKSSSNQPTTTDSKASTSSADAKIADMDKKWADRFNRLEALLLAKTIDPPRDPVFSTVKVTPAHASPANVVRNDPFIKPTAQPSQPTDPAGDSATDSSHPKSDIKASSSVQPDPPAATTVKRHLLSAFDVSHKESSSSDSDSDSSSDRPFLDILPEEGELSDDQEANISDQEQSLSEEQSYPETMRGIRSFMGWDHIPDIDSGTTTSEDNPFAGPKPHATGKVSINLPTDEWLCRKMAKLNITLTQGYPPRTSEAGALQRDQFIRPPKSQ